MIIFTDGACKGNGKKTAKASWAFYDNNKLIKRGLVNPFEYKLLDGNNLQVTDISINPSNNRGELLAVIFALLYINECGNITEYNVIYSDSLITVNTINIWYNNRKKKGTLHEFKNLDLINIIMELFNKFINTKCEHVLAHRKYSKNFSEDEEMLWNGNNIVDKYATELLNSVQNNTTEYEEILI